MQPPSRFRSAIAEHLGSREVSRVIYGAVIGLALSVALEQHPPGAAASAALLLLTAIAVGLAELYSDLIGAEAATRTPITRAHVRAGLEDALPVVFGAGLPALFPLLAALGVMQLATAFDIAKWTGAGLLCGYGFAAARLAGAGRGRAVLHAAAVGAVGFVLIGLKALLH